MITFVLCLTFVFVVLEQNSIRSEEKFIIRDLTNTSKWVFKFSDEKDYRSVTLPKSWESFSNVSKTKSGIGVFKTSFFVNPIFKEHTLSFEGISYHSEVYINTKKVISHTGSWDSFHVSITDFLNLTGENLLEIYVEKPAPLTKGPDSPLYPGNFPITETLSGFLPYVQGFLFGGIWQPIYLISTPSVYIIREKTYIKAFCDGKVQIELELKGNSNVEVTIEDVKGKKVFSEVFEVKQKIKKEVELKKGSFQTWSPSDPNLYFLRIKTEEGEQQTIQFGFRTVNYDKSTGNVILNDNMVIYPRFVLNWGYYFSLTNKFDPYINESLIREYYKKVKKLGFNGIKFCLWIPPKAFYKVAKEEGLMIWQEFPIWKNENTKFFQEQTPIELDKILDTIKNNFNIIIYTIGCEISNLESSFLNNLFDLVEKKTGEVLIATNSGGSEAYGNINTMNAKSNFYDNHFYCDKPNLDELILRFTPQWRGILPWFFGEYNDKDTFRNIKTIIEQTGEIPYFLVNDSTINPQGCRWDYSVVDHMDLMKKHNFWNYSNEIEKMSIKQSKFHRKITLESTRKSPFLNGYVMTVDLDTPVSTSGFFSDLFDDKYNEEFLKWNNDVVLLLGFDRQRDWISGGDTMQFFSKWNYFDDQYLRIHLIISNYGDYEGIAKYEYIMYDENGKIVFKNENTTKRVIEKGKIQEIDIIEYFFQTQQKQKINWNFQLKVSLGNNIYQNNWSFNIISSKLWSDVKPFSVIDDLEILNGLEKVSENFNRVLTKNRVAIVSRMSKEVEEFVSNGGNVILLQRLKKTGMDFLDVIEKPFWRECTHILENSWNENSFVGIEYLPISAKKVLKSWDKKCKNLHSRIDLRSMELESYLLECDIGEGRILITTLLFEGNIQDLPSGIQKNTMGQYFLKMLLKRLE